MPDTSPPAGLLDRAEHVFALAAELGWEFQKEHQQTGTGHNLLLDHRAWERHAPAFKSLTDGLLDLSEAMQYPPAGFKPVAEALFKLGRTVRQIRDVTRAPSGQAGASYQQFFVELSSDAAAGREAIKEVTKARRLDDPPAFLDQPAAAKNAGIDTTPALARPPADRIEAAGRAIPEVLSDVPHDHGEAAELVASDLATRIKDQGHNLAAAHWAIHEAVQAGRLRTGQVVVGLPFAVGIPHWNRHLSGEWTGGGTGTKPIPEGEPAPFDNFKVIATESLWAWWRSHENEPTTDAGHLPTGKVPGVVSLNVLRVTLTMLAFVDWRRRFESWPEVPELRLACARLFPGQPFSDGTIELLIAWFQKRGLSPERARHLPLAEAVRRLDAMTTDQGQADADSTEAGRR